MEGSDRSGVESPAKLRAAALGRVARDCPVAIRGDLGRLLNADFAEGSKEWRGDLYVLDGQKLLYVQMWPQPYARMREKQGGPWAAHNAHIDVARGVIGLARRGPLASLVDWLPSASPPETGAAETETDWAFRAMQRVPDEIRKRLARFRFGQWHLLHLIGKDTRALDLIDSNPALAWALASAEELVEGDATWIASETVERVVQRQRDIAGWLGFPANEPSVRILKKVPPDSCGVLPLQDLRHLVRIPSVAKDLSHLRELPAPVILALNSRILAPMLTPAVLEEIVAEIARLRSRTAQSDRPCGPSVVHLLEDTARMARMLPGAHPPRPVHSIDALRRRHDQLVDLFLALSRPPPRPPRLAETPTPGQPAPRAEPPRPTAKPKRRYFGKRFPPPPFPGGEGIEPITNSAELKQLALEFHNCCLSYFGDLSFGRYAIYRIRQPKPAVLGLKRDYEGRWHIDQLLGARNHKVSRTVMEHVEGWFRRASAGNR